MAPRKHEISGKPFVNSDLMLHMGVLFYQVNFENIRDE